MTGKKFVKAFIAGMALPAAVLPIAYTLLYLNFRSPLTAHALQFIPMFLPLVWGLANAIYVKLQEDSSPKKANGALIVTGACLGFLVAVFAIFIVHAPTMMLGRSSGLQYLPLIIVPVIYAVLWRYVVKWINKLLGV